MPRRREHYTRMELGEMVHTHPVCGCQLVREDPDGAVALYQCRTHEIAEATEAAIKYALTFASAIKERTIVARLRGALKGIR